MNSMKGQNASVATLYDNASHLWTLVELLRFVVRRWRLLAGVCVLAVVVVAVIMLFTSNYYVSTASMLPSGKTDNMSALKEAVGISSSANMDENSSALFPIVLQSRTIADTILARTYRIMVDGQATLIDLSKYFELTDPDELRQALAAATTVEIEKKTGDIHIAVETRYPALSQALVQAYLDALEDFNLNRRKSVAHENARYLVGQVARARDSMRIAEDSLANFRRHNADWAGSTNAEVVADLTRLQREVEVKTSTYVYLQQQLEMARIDEQKDVPIVRVLDTPSFPTLKSRPRRVLSVLLGGLAAFLLTTLFALVREHLHREASGPNAGTIAALKSDLSRHIPGASRILKFTARAPAAETAITDRDQ